MIIPNIWENKIDVPNHQPDQQSSTIWSSKSVRPPLSNAVLSIRFELTLVFGAVGKGQFALAAGAAQNMIKPGQHRDEYIIFQTLDQEWRMMMNDDE